MVEEVLVMKKRLASAATRDQNPKRGLAPQVPVFPISIPRRSIYRRSQKNALTFRRRCRSLISDFLPPGLNRLPHLGSPLHMDG